MTEATTQAPRDGALQELANDLQAAWSALPRKGMFFGLLTAWLALFHWLGNSTFGYVDTPSLFGWMGYSYGMSQDDELGTYVPLIVLGLLWWKRDDLRRVRAAAWWPGLLLLALALLIHLAGFALQHARISIVGFYFGLYALIGVVWGWGALKATFFPCFLFAFAVPLGTLGEAITFPLRLVATHITTWLSHAVLGIDIIQQGTQLFDAEHSYQYEVAAACGGLRSVTATLALALIYAFVSFKSPWKRLVVIASAFPLAVAGNVLRLTMIIVAAEAFGQEAGNWVHENSWLSLLPYVPAFVGLGLLGSWLRGRTPAPGDDAPGPAAPVGRAA